MNARQEILESVRQHLARDTNPHTTQLPNIDRESLGNNTNELVERLHKECEAVGTSLHLLRDIEHASTVLDDLVQSREVQRLAISHDSLVRSISSRVIGNHDVIDAGAARSEIEQVDLGISTARLAIAEHGTFVLVPEDDDGRLVALLPPQHIIVLPVDRIVGTLAEALQHLASTHQGTTPPNVTFVSGPSRTADIEQTLVTGIHGPAPLDIFLIEDTENTTS